MINSYITSAYKFHNQMCKKEDIQYVQYVVPKEKEK